MSSHSNSKLNKISDRHNLSHIYCTDLLFLFTPFIFICQPEPESINTKIMDLYINTHTHTAVTCKFLVVVIQMEIVEIVKSQTDTTAPDGKQQSMSYRTYTLKVCVWEQLLRLKIIIITFSLFFYTFTSFALALSGCICGSIVLGYYYCC